MKAVATYQKLRGGYYTPKPIADFLANWAIQSPECEVLEPSCGDGMVLAAAVEALIKKGADEQAVANHLVHGVEIDPHEALKAAGRIHDLGLTTSPVQIHIGDFFAYCKERLDKEHFFDAVIGNPPFIRYQNFLEEHRATAFYIMQQTGLHPNRLTNAWVPFLVASTLLLKKHGRIAMVIPAELLQVDYAAELRYFLSNYYSNIALVTFKKLVFDGIQQEVVLLLGERNGDTHTGIRTIEFEGLEALSSYSHSDLSASELKPMDHSAEKWTRYFLDKEEIELLRTIRAHPGLVTAGHVIDVDVGIVTGLNEFFVLTEQQVKAQALEPYTHRIVGRSGHLLGVIFSDEDWKANVEKQHPAFLLRSPDVPFGLLPGPVKEYVIKGEQKEMNKGYKCRIRKHWYVVPSVWTPQAFMLRQVHNYPKIIINEANATCTDTIHRVKLLNGVKAATIASAFLNSLTFAFAEVTGRSYGGGVLELEPREAEKLPIPLRGAEALDIRRIDVMLQSGKIEDILDITDKLLLRDSLGLSDAEIKMLREIWQKLRDRRINRK
jgi:adenine-specific DNA-methyltransferase